MTQSALSGLIKELEQTLGLRVIDRSTRKIRLSQVGRDLHPLIDKIVHDSDDVLDDVSNLKSLKTGLVRVAASQLMASTLIPEAIAAYAREQPAIRIKLVDCAVESVMSRVFSGEVDFGIGPERDPNSDITATPLFEAPFMAVFPPGHALGLLPKIGWSDLMRFPVVPLQGQFTERLAIDLSAKVRGAKLLPTNEVAFMSTALSMVNAGLGVTVCIPDAASLVRLYRLEMRTLGAPVLNRCFFIFSRREQSLSPAAISFMEFLFQYVAAGHEGIAQWAATGSSRPRGAA